MEFAPPPEFNIQPGGPPLWVKFAEWGFYGFKPTICALCCLKTHDISQCLKREYFPGFIQEHTNMINDSKRSWNNPYSEFYTPSLQKHFEQYFEQFNVPQKLSVEDKLAKLLESTELYIEITNQGFQIQAFNCGKSFNDQKEIGAGTEEQSAPYSNPREETTHAESEFLPEPTSTHVYVPHELFPQKLQDCVETDGLNRVVHTELGSEKSNGSAPAKPIIIGEIKGKSMKQTTFYKGQKRQLCGSQIPHRQIRPVHKLWVLNTRFKPIRRKSKHCWKELYLLTKIHAHTRVDIKASTKEFRCTVVNHLVTPYPLLAFDAVKEWLILQEQIT